MVGVGGKLILNGWGFPTGGIIPKSSELMFFNIVLGMFELGILYKSTTGGEFKNNSLL